jgi:hypothetical protein
MIKRSSYNKVNFSSQSSTIVGIYYKPKAHKNQFHNPIHWKRYKNQSYKKVNKKNQLNKELINLKVFKS